MLSGNTHRRKLCSYLDDWVVLAEDSYDSEFTIKCRIDNFFQVLFEFDIDSFQNYKQVRDSAMGR